MIKKDYTCKIFTATCLGKLIVAYAHRFTRQAFVLSPLRESPRHLNQNFSSSFFKDEGFLPAKEAPGMSSSVRIMSDIITIRVRLQILQNAAALFTKYVS